MASGNENHVPGYEPVVIRSVVKRQLKDFRFSELKISRDKHIERNLVTAAIRTVMADENAKKIWLQMLQEEMVMDVQLEFAST